MTGVTERIRGWLGWCPDAQYLRTSQPELSAPPLGNPTALPDGGSPGSGRIRRGTAIAAQSMKILGRNRRLLWFSFLIFLTFIVSMVADLSIRSVTGISASPVDLNSAAILWAALTFIVAFVVNFVFFYPAAALVICVAQIPAGNSIGMRQGLSLAWDHRRSLAGWTLIGALLWIPVGVFATGFYLITLFALPAMVLGNRDMAAAMRESVVIFRRMWVETYVSFAIILLVTIGFVLVTLFFLGRAGSAYGSLISGMIPGLISLVVSGLMAVGLVVMGIATVILYTDEKTGVPGNR